MTNKNSMILTVIVFFTFLLFSCTKVNFSELEGLQDRFFYLDIFETSTFEIPVDINLTSRDIIKLQNHYACNLPLPEIKRIIEKKLNIQINSTEFESAVKKGPITDNKCSKTENNHGQWYSRWEAPSTNSHKNQIIIWFSVMKDRNCPVFNYCIYLKVDGKLVEIDYKNQSEIGIHDRLSASGLKPDRWNQYHYECLAGIPLSIKTKIEEIKR